MSGWNTSTGGTQKYSDLEPLFISNAAAWGTSGVPVGVYSATAAYADIYGEGYTLDQTGLCTAAGVVQSPVCVVSGKVGDTVLPATYNTSLFANAVADCAVSASDGSKWAAVIQHSDGTHGVYTVVANDASTMTIKPGLRKAAYNGRICNAFEASFSQHLTRNGCRALVDHIRATHGTFAKRKGIIYRWNETDTDTNNTAEGSQGWTAIGGYSLAASGFNTPLNTFPNSSNYGSNVFARNTRMLLNDATGAGKGIQKIITTSGLAGWLETYVGLMTGDKPVTVKVIKDFGLGTEETLAYFPAVYGLERITQVFPQSTNICIQIVTLTATRTAFAVGTTTLFKLPEKHDVVIPDGARVVWLGDSWGHRHGSEIQNYANRNDRGQTWMTVSKASQTTAWGLSVFDSLVTPNKPDAVIIEFFVNDSNGAGGITQAEWVNNLALLAGKCKAINAKPIILMPVGCEDANAAQALMTWETYLENHVAANQSVWYQV